MAISDQIRAHFKAIGKELIQRELAAGDIRYLGISDDKRAQAKEWVEEQEAEVRGHQAVAQSLETTRFETIRMWTIIAAVAGAIAALTGVIALFR